MRVEVVGDLAHPRDRSGRVRPAARGGEKNAPGDASLVERDAGVRRGRGGHERRDQTLHVLEPI